MNRQVYAVWTVLALVTLSSSVEAQERQRRRGGFSGTNVVQLVRNDAVRKDVAVTDEQGGKLRELLASYQKEAGEVPRVSREEIQKLSDEERQKKFREMREARNKLTTKYREKLADVLEKKQMERLNQIRLQTMGSSAYRDPAVVKALDITREQQQKLNAARNKFLKELRQAEGRPTAEQYAKAREKLNAKVKELITEEQQKKFKELTGKPFDVSKLRRRPRRRQSNGE